mgnify:CR=1 FL=1
MDWELIATRLLATEKKHKKMFTQQEIKDLEKLKKVIESVLCEYYNKGGRDG